MHTNVLPVTNKKNYVTSVTLYLMGFDLHDAPKSEMLGT